MRKKFSIKGRIAALFIFFVSVLCIYAIAIYDLQVANRDEYTSSDSSITVTTETVEATRGDILDRCGRVLVTSQESYNLSIDMNEIRSQDDPNEALLEIIKFAGIQGFDHIDTFPVSAKAPFSYIEDMSDTQASRLEAYMEYFELDADLPAGELLAFMADNYEIDTSKYSDAELRELLGLRYEIGVRNIVNISAYVFAEDVDNAVVARILEQDIAGLRVDTTSKRVYNTPYAAHILGHIGLMNEEEYEKYKDLGYAMDAYIGKDGVEQTFEEYLKGTDGIMKVGTNYAGVVTAVEAETETVPGNDVMLTIDIGLQGAAEKALQECIDDINSTRGENEDLVTGGAVVAVQVNTGEILAIASSPTFDITTYMENYTALANDESNPLYNRATQGTYSPGSTFKMVTATAALGEGVISTGTSIYDEGRYTAYESYQPKCWIYPGSHGYENVVDAIRDSCNYFFYVVGTDVGIDNISAYAANYGLGQASGIELPESTGILASRTYKESVKNQDWYVGDTLQAAIGQSYNLFTPVQMANYAATIASDGNRYSAHLLKEVLAYDDSAITWVYEPKLLSRVEVSDSIFAAVKEGMRQVAEASSLFKDYPVTVATKTGTVQSESTTKNNGVFVCFAPYENPEIAVAVVIEKGGSGSAVGRVAKDVLDYYFSDAYAVGADYSENVVTK